MNKNVVANLASILPENASPEIYGGKAANLSKMIKMGLPVPPGFVSVTGLTEALGRAKDDSQTEKLYKFSIDSAIREISGEKMGHWNSGQGKPLTVSVRSGAPISMPGMMDTILNVGMTTDNLDAFTKYYGDEKFTLDCYRRLIQMFGSTVDGIPNSEFSKVWNSYNTFYYDGITKSAYEDMIDKYYNIYQKYTGKAFPDDANEQLIEACKAVYRSWYSEKAEAYRKIEDIDSSLGTAVTVQKMVFGNLDNSATGVVFTHNPNTGQLGLFGDFLEGAQGEDVVSGAFKVQSINTMLNGKYQSLGKELQAHLRTIYNTEKDIIDVEFTIEQGKLWILQYRKAKRSTKASVRFIIDLAKRNEINSTEASRRFMALLPKKKVTLEDHKDLEHVTKGIGVTSDIAVGKAALTQEFVDKCIENEEPYIFIANETAPEDTPKMKDAEGILTAQGGTMSHAAVVARGWDKPCVVSATQLKILEEGFSIAGMDYTEGDIVKIDGSSGSVWM